MDFDMKKNFGHKIKSSAKHSSKKKKTLMLDKDLKSLLDQLSDTVLFYQDPLEPVGLNDWGVFD